MTEEKREHRKTGIKPGHSESAINSRMLHTTLDKRDNEFPRGNTARTSLIQKVIEEYFGFVQQFPQEENTRVILVALMVCTIFTILK